MEWDREREQKKREELRAILLQKLNSNPDTRDNSGRLAEELMSICVHTTPPEKNAAEFFLITMHPSGRGGGKSRKAGNIRINMGKFIEALSAGALTAVGAVQMPITIPLAIIVLWNSIWRCVDVELSENDAAVIYVMWMHKDSNQEVEEAQLLGHINTHLHKYGRTPLTWQDVKHSLKVLESIGTIQRSKNHKGFWWLCEWVRSSYQ